MHLTKLLAKISGIEAIQNHFKKRRLQEEAELEAERLIKKEQERQQKFSRQIHAMRRYSTLKLKKEEFEALPKGKDFVCTPLDFVYPNPIIVIGKIVPREHGFAEQMGAALFSLPERVVNRYQLEIVD